MAPGRKKWAVDGGRGRQGDLTEGRGGKKERRERIHQWYGGEGAEGGNRESKGGGDGRREYGKKGDVPSFSAADSRVYKDSSWLVGGSTSGGLVTSHGGDGGHYVVSKGR